MPRRRRSAAKAEDAKSTTAPKRRKKRSRYSDARRSRILEAAHSMGLTAAQVQRRFGVTPVTFYSWRRKAKTGLRRLKTRMSRGPGVVESGLNVVDAVRVELRAQIQRILPELVRTEVGAALLGPARRRRRR